MAGLSFYTRERAYLLFLRIHRRARAALISRKINLALDFQRMHASGELRGGGGGCDYGSHNGLAD